MSIFKRKFYKFSKQFGTYIKKNLYSKNILKTKFSKSLFHFSSYIIFEKKYNYQKKTKKIDIILWPIWGDKFYKYFLDYCLPSLMQRETYYGLLNNIMSNLIYIIEKILRHLRMTKISIT